MKKSVTRKKTLETLVLPAAVLLVLYLVSHKTAFALAALALLSVALVFRETAARLAGGWLAFSEVVGGLGSRLVLGGVYFLVLTPLAFAYRVFGGVSAGAADPSAKSYFEEKKHLFVPADLKKPW
jgi:hypothetical protein